MSLPNVGEEKSKPEIAITVDALIAKTIDALGGEANMRKITSRVTTFELDAINQGVKGYGKIYQKTPNKSASKTTLTALGKKIGWIKEFFDGTMGREEYSFARNEEHTGKRLEDIKVSSSFYTFLDWKSRLEKAEIVRMGKVGGEDAYVVAMQPKNASKFWVHISTKTFLPLKKTSIILSSTSSQTIPVTEVYSNHKNVDGLMIPFKITSNNPGMGEIITYVKKVKHNIRIGESKFRKK